VVIAHTEPLTQHQIAQLSVLLKTTLGPATAAKEFYQIEQIDRGAMGKTNRAQIRQIIDALGKPQ
jgi:acyl-coenzyme A synthetase/AMP-(fatty) acid ligase